MAGINLKLKFTDNTTQMLTQLQRGVAGIIEDAYDVFVDNTPVRTGNARRRTRLTKDTIEAKYDYANKLDGGSSKQSPQGMTEPTLDFIEQQFKKIAKGK
tara:strand:+ start:3700 stop:3999 length:300 start_codon:yes stop_codon:yes gene_type:complete